MPNLLCGALQISNMNVLRSIISRVINVDFGLPLFWLCEHIATSVNYDA